MNKHIKVLAYRDLINRVYGEGPRITITKPIIRTNDGNYKIIGKEYEDELSPITICATLSETEFNELTNLTTSLNNYKEEA